MRELVTIQVGDFANYIGSHFWNFQDELLGLADDPHGDPIYKSPSLNMDVLYRPGETLQGIPTYTPRMISIGLHGSLGSMPSCGSLYNKAPSTDHAKVITWSGKISRQVAEPYKRNLFLESLYEEENYKPELGTSTGNGHLEKVLDKDIAQCLENDVHFWTDYSKVHYHPRSLYELCCSWIHTQKFDNYGTGRDALSDGSQGEELKERLRFFIEECDHIQGIQFIVDDSGGFSSVAADFLETIADEYSKTPVLLYTARDPNSYGNAVSQKQSVSRALHDAISFSRLTSSSQLIVPIGLPSLSRSSLSSILNINDSKPFHTSAVYAASIQSICLPFRMETLGPASNSEYAVGAVDVGELVEILAGQNRQNMVNILDVAMPVPFLSGLQSQGHLQRSFHSLTPDVVEDPEDLQAVESVIIQGAIDSGGHRASLSDVIETYSKAYENGLPRPMFSHLSAALCPLPIPLPFPSIFGGALGLRGVPNGSQIIGGRSTEPPEITSIPMAARLRSSKAILPFIKKRLGNLERFGIQRASAGAQLLSSWGLSKEEVEDMGEVLSKIVMSLDSRHDTSSDSD